MSTVFFEIIIDAIDFSKMEVEGRDEVEDLLCDALSEADIGDVTGGGSGSGSVIIDVEIEEESDFNKGLPIIRKVLRDLKSPKGTIIKRSKPSQEIYDVWLD